MLSKLDGSNGATTFEQACARWSTELERRIQEGCAVDALVGEMSAYHLSSGGKRLRALLPLWICDNLGGRPESAFDMGVGLELLHNATLVHDDLQDGDTFRRGRPTVWRRWGAAQAINAGDALLFRGLERIARAPRGKELVPVTCDVMVNLIVGQAMDLQLHLPEGDPNRIRPTLDIWLETARRKTAALFSLCFRAGATAAEVDAATIRTAADYGESLGLLFQVQDDLVDLVGCNGREAPGADLKNGKASFPVLWAYEHAEKEDVLRLRRVVDCRPEETTREMVENAIVLLEETGAVAATVDWLRNAEKIATEHPLSCVVPGLIARFLAPVNVTLDRISGVQPSYPFGQARQ